MCLYLFCMSITRFASKTMPHTNHLSEYFNWRTLAIRETELGWECWNKLPLRASLWRNKNDYKYTKYCREDGIVSGKTDLWNFWGYRLKEITQPCNLLTFTFHLTSQPYLHYMVDLICCFFLMTLFYFWFYWRRLFLSPALSEWCLAFSHRAWFTL